MSYTALLNYGFAHCGIASLLLLLVLLCLVLVSLAVLLVLFALLVLLVIRWCCWCGSFGGDVGEFGAAYCGCLRGVDRVFRIIGVVYVPQVLFFL